MLKRIFIVLIAVTVLLMLVYTGMVYFSKNTNTNANTAATDTSKTANSQQNDNANAARVGGDIAIGKSLTYKDTAFEFDTAMATTAFRTQKASEGKQFIVLFLKPFAVVPKDNPLEWAGKDIKLTDSGELNEVPYEIAIPSAVGQQGGYLAFQVPLAKKQFTLVFGSGKTKESFDFSI
ncbi:MAG: hypothetical protein V1907_00690 [Candidatus Kerfeldbacteria bacterium]